MNVIKTKECSTTTSTNNPSPSQQLVIWNGRECKTYSQENLPEWKLLIKLEDRGLLLLQDPAYLGTILRPLHAEDVRPDPFLDFPYELDSSITQYLDPKAITALALVSKRFLNSFQNLFYPITEAGKKRPIPLSKLGSFHHLPNLQKLWIQMEDPTQASIDMKPLRRVRYLNLCKTTCPSYYGVIHSINHILRYFPKLKILDLQKCQYIFDSIVKKILKKNPNLKGLILSSLEKKDKTQDDHCILGLQNCANLKLFSLRDADFRITEVDTIFKDCTKLRYLDLGKTHRRLRNSIIQTIFRSNPELEYFSPRGFPDDENLLHERVKLHPQLKFLSTFGICSLTENGLCEAIKKLPMIEYLCIGPVTDDSDPTKSKIPFDRMKEYVKNLKFLEILSTKGTEEKALIEFIALHPQLTSLIIGKPTDEALSDTLLYTLANNKDLKILDFRGPTQFTKDAFLNLVHSCKNLRVLTIPASNFDDDELREIVQACSHMPVLKFEGRFFSNVKTVKQLKGHFAIQHLFICEQGQFDEEITREFCKRCKGMTSLQHNFSTLDTTTFQILYPSLPFSNPANDFIDNLIQRSMLQNKILQLTEE